MSDFSYINWNSFSDKSICEKIGTHIKKQRIERNLTQQETAKQASISRSTLSLLEKGETVTLRTLIQVLRVLDALDSLNGFHTQKTISPIMMAKEEQKQRYRVRKNKTNQQPESEW